MQFTIPFLLVTLQTMIIYPTDISIRNYFLVVEKNDQLLRITEKIINCCFNKNNYFFFKNKNPTDENTSNILFSASTPLYLFDTYHESAFKVPERFQRADFSNETLLSRQNFPATDVTIMITSDENLSLVLLKMKNSIWWNPGARFLLINTATGGCQRAYHFMRILWSYNVLAAIYLCTKFSSEVSIYTYNPYSRTAPTFWNQVPVEYSTNDWSMFQFAEEKRFEILSNNQTSNFPLCSIIFYDKIKKLENYNIRMVILMSPKSFHHNGNKSFIERCDSAFSKIICTILQHIGATVTLKISNKTGFTDRRRDPPGPIRDVMDNVVDIMANPLLLRDSWRSQLYPFYPVSVKIISRKLAHETDHKFVIFFKSDSWIYFSICYFVCVMVTKYIFQVSLPDATLEFLRMFVSMSSLRQPRKFISRILFMIVLMIIFATSSFFQSHLSAVSTIPNPVAMIDSAEDLINSNLSIYGGGSYKEYIPYAELRERYNVYNNPGACAKQLSNGDHIACLMVNFVYPYFFSESKSIHVSKRNVVEKYLSHILTKDSPLLYELNDISARLFEGGFLKFHLELEKLHHMKNLDGTDLPKSIDFYEFQLISLILPIGWSTGIFVFFSEICICQLRRAIEK